LLSFFKKRHLIFFEYPHRRLLRVEAYQAAHRKRAIFQILDPFLFRRQAATRRNDRPKHFLRGPEAKDDVTPPIRPDFAYRSSEPEMFPQMAPGL